MNWLTALLTESRLLAGAGGGTALVDISSSDQPPSSESLVWFGLGEFASF